MSVSYTEPINASKYINDLNRLISERNKFRKRILNDKLQKLGLQETIEFTEGLRAKLELQQKPVTDRLDLTIGPRAKLDLVNQPNLNPEIPSLKYEAEDLSEEEIDAIRIIFGDLRRLPPTLPDSLKPKITERGFFIGNYPFVINTENETIYDRNNPDEPYELTDSLIALIKGDDIDNHTDGDKEKYYNLLSNMKVMGRHRSTRFKRLKTYFEDPERTLTAETPSTSKKGKGICGRPVIISDNINELFDRLNILISARKEGHRSVDSENEINAILKTLLERKVISIQQFKKFI